MSSVVPTSSHTAIRDAAGASERSVPERASTAISSLDSRHVPLSRAEPVAQSELRLLAAILLVGVLLRVAVVSWLPNATPVGDELTYLEGAQSFLTGEIYHETRAPGYSAFIALTQLLARDPAPQDVVMHLERAGFPITVTTHQLTVARIGNVVLGVSALLLAWGIGRTLLGRTAGLLMVGWLAIHPRHVSAPLYFYAENLYAPCMMAGVYLAIRCVRSPRLLWSLASGAGFGLAALARDMALYFIPVAAGLTYWLSRGSGTLAIRRTLALLLGAVVTILPWTERNYSVYGKFIPVSFSEGIPLLEGNLRDTGRFERRSEIELNSIREWARKAPEMESDRYIPGARYGEIYANQQIRGQAIKAILDRQPEWIFEKTYVNGPRLIHPLVNFPQLWDLAPESSRSWVRRAHVLSFLPLHALLLILAPFGVAQWRLRSPYVFPLAFLLFSFFVHIVVNGGISRFHYPYEWVLVLMATTCLAVGLPKGRVRLAAAVLLLALVVLSQLLVLRSWTDLGPWTPVA